MDDESCTEVLELLIRGDVEMKQIETTAAKTA